MPDRDTPTGPGESFEETMRSVAERVKSPEEQEEPEGTAGSEEKKIRELEQIKTELQKTYGAGSKEKNTIIPPPMEKTEQDNYLAGVTEEYQDKIEGLVKHAVSDGILPAVTTAQKENDPYIMDSFHDALTYFLHQKMQDQDLL